MSNVFGIIIIIIILAALAGSVIAGISLFTMIFDDVKFELPEISELIPELPNDSNLDDIKIEKKVQPTSKPQPTPETTIVFHIDKSTYKEIVEFHVSGKITNYNFPELAYIYVYDVDTGEKVAGHDYRDATDDKLIDYGSYLFRSNIDVLYKVEVSHNGVNASKTFIVEGVDETKTNEVQSITKPTNATFWGNTVSVPQVGFVTTWAHCENGYKAISGGAKTLLGNLTVIDSNPVRVNAWEVRVTNIGSTEGAYIAYVDCILK